MIIAELAAATHNRGMKRELRVTISEDVPGPQALAVLQHLAGQPGDLAMLHAVADEGGTSVLGFGTLESIVLDARTSDPLKALEQAVAAVGFDAIHPLVGWLG